MDGADDGKDDVAIGVNEVAFLLAVAVVGAGVAHLGDGEGGDEFRLLAADGDGELVVLLDGGLVALKLFGGDAVLRVAQVDDFFGADAGVESGEEQGGCADEGGPAELCVGFHMRDVVSEKGWLFRYRGWGGCWALGGVSQKRCYI